MENQEWKLPLINNYLDKWAIKTPKQIAIIQHEDDKSVTYKGLQTLTDFFALRLVDLGIKKGDIIATQLALFPEHIALMYACLKIGVIFSPMDLRLKKEEVKRDLDKIKPKMFFFLGKTPIIDFNEIGEYIRDNCNYIDFLVQVLADPSKETSIKGAITIQQMMSKPKLVWLKIKDVFSNNLNKIYKTINTKDAAIIIFTTGTTGTPKPALMSHENVIVQNQILAEGTGMIQKDITLVNLPPSHVGCLTEAMLSTFYLGGTAVFLKVFNVQLSLQAIEKHKVTLLGQIPTQYRMMWAEPDYDKYDLSSLRFAIYGGSAVDVEFLNKLASMAPKFGTGIGMTETAGFSTFTPDGITVEEMAGQVGRYFEHLGKVTIRKPMKEDGSAGEEQIDGEIGEICYSAPIVFMGYYNFPEETKKTISTDGILYSGDLGYFKNMSNYKALYLSGREKFVIKQKGYQVFPDEVQAFIAEHPKVDQVDVIGVKHKIFDEGIFAFVKPKKDENLNAEEIMEHCKNIASYKRPQHIELWPVDKDFPITRSTKIDKLELQKEAILIVENLRTQGKWDA
ncbi:MAG: acyl--CoA ligase [Bacteroidales bacterium]|nr:acyl--CoA ligase [Bacteroidales bacterium]MBN2755559.1 acyl--CoA ligase [Bacteroidales bacterium]